MYQFEKIKMLESINKADNTSNIFLFRHYCLQLLFDETFDSSHIEVKFETLINAINEDALFINSNFPNLKEITNSLYLLLYSNNFEIIKNAFYSLYENQDLKQFILTVYDIYEEKLKYEYASKLSQFYTPDGTFVDKNGINYPNVVDITNEDFFLNVHNIYIGFSNDIHSQEITQHPNKFTEKNFGYSEIISGTIISPDFISYAVDYHNDEVLYGFNHLLKDDILSVGNDDLNSKWDISKNVPIIRNKTPLFTPDTLLDHVKYKYTESLIWRSTQGKKRSPDYILCVDTINKNSIIHANHFNIPIYFIDSIKLLNNKLHKLKEEFKKLKNNHSLNLVEIKSFLDKIRSYSNQLFGISSLHYSNQEYYNIKDKFDQFEEEVNDYFKAFIYQYETKDNEVNELFKRSIIKEHHLFYKDNL